jgi:NAD+ diphosphatase
MIQDIAPNRYDRSYSLESASPFDRVLCYDKGRVLLRRNGEEWQVPRFCDFPAGDGTLLGEAQHLFAMDGEAYYRARNALPEARDGFEYCPYQDLRAVRPMETAFVAVTGAQLDRWYKSRAYCGRCGSAMAPGQTERSMVCPQCGMIEYPKICPAVIVAVTNGDKLLLTRYANRPFKGYALIAGFVEIGETLEETVHREVMEEVGVRVKNLRYYKNQPWSFTDTLLTGFYCELDGDAAITLDHNELCEGFWMARSELPERKNDVSLTAEMIERFRQREE